MTCNECQAVNGHWTSCPHYQRWHLLSNQARYVDKLVLEARISAEQAWRAHDGRGYEQWHERAMRLYRAGARLWAAAAKEGTR